MLSPLEIQGEGVGVLRLGGFPGLQNCRFTKSVGEKPKTNFLLKMQQPDSGESGCSSCSFLLWHKTPKYYANYFVPFANYFLGCAGRGRSVQRALSAMDWTG